MCIRDRTFHGAGTAHNALALVYRPAFSRPVNGYGPDGTAAHAQAAINAVAARHWEAVGRPIDVCRHFAPPVLSKNLPAGQASTRLFPSGATIMTISH